MTPDDMAEQRNSALLGAISSAVSAVNAQSDVTRDLAEQIRAQRADIAALRVLLEQGAPVLIPDPPAPEPAPNPPAAVEDDPPGTYRTGTGASVRRMGAVWAITDGGRITRSGAPATDPDLTADVVMIGIDPDGGIVQRNSLGDVYRFNGSPNWTWLRRDPAVPTIEISGTISA